MRAFFAVVASALLGACSVAQAGQNGPRASNIVLMIMENRDDARIIGSPDAPYINEDLLPQAASMTASHAIGHPSQPNYLALFSGSTQAVRDDSCPHRFSAANVGEELTAAGERFGGYSESMPYDGYAGCFSGEYARKHNPWVNFSNVPAGANLVFNDFPKSPPALAIVVPNLCNDMHDCSTHTGDAWLKAHLPPILAYNHSHDGLLILTWDEAEPDADGTNRIPTLLIGPMVKPGSYAASITHYSVLRTIENILGVACTANACRAAEIERIWR